MLSDPPVKVPSVVDPTRRMEFEVQAAIEQRQKGMERRKAAAQF
jgi:hypothetical protein